MLSLFFLNILQVFTLVRYQNLMSPIVDTERFASAALAAFAANGVG